MEPSPEKLSSIITNACISSNFPSQYPRDFLPQGELEQIITQKSITGELKCHDDDPLVDFILKDARKLFAICIMSFIQKLKPTMELFREHNISDNNLPFLHSQAGSNSDIGQCFQECDLANKNYFMNTQQWTFLAPVFSVRLDNALALVQYVEGVIFPFIETEEKTEGGFGTVYRVRIPKSHLDGDPNDPVLKENCNAAIKELKASINMSQTNTQAYKAWRREAVALERIRSFRHPHVIETSAIFSKGRKQYFMFPWADGGNLWEFWEKDPSPDLTVDFIRDIMEQVTGLAHALKILHNNNCRHGDLKPENILIFTSKEQQGVWKMADMGLAKFHQDVTNERVHTTSNKFGGTISYEPPEVAPRVGPRSRLYDTWCVGCITLQLVIWLLYGLEGHRNFTNNLYDNEKGHSSFWTNRLEPQVHPAVAGIMDDLSTLLRNDTKSPALEALLHIVRSKLLVVDLGSRATADVFYSEMKEIQEQGQQDKKYWLEYQLRSNSSTFTSPPEAPNSMNEDGQAGYSN